MNEEEKFDELLSSKLSERDFPFDELNWDEAERLIIQQENQRKATRFALIFSGGLLAGILIMVPFILTTRHTPPNVTVANSMVNPNSVKQNIAPRPVDEKESPGPVHSAFVSNDKRTGRRGNNTSVSSNPRINKTNSVASVSNVKKTSKRNGTIAIASKPGVIAFVAKTNNNNPTHTETVNQSQVGSATEASAVSSPQTVDKSVVANETLPNKKDTAKSQEASKVADNSSPNTDRVYTPGLALNPSVQNTSNKSDSNTNRVSQANPEDVPKPKTGDLYKSILSVYAGGNYSFGWSSEGDKEANGITPWVGLAYTHYFSGNIALSLGAGYSELINLNKTYNSSILQYDFGANSSTTTVTPQKVYYMAFPLKVQYDIDNRDLIGIGCDYLLMMTTYSTLTTYKQNYFTETPGSSEKQNGYTQGFSNTYWKFMLSYTRMLTARLGVNIEYYRDLGYVENNTISTLTQSEKNSGLRLVLSYQILK